MTRRRSKPNPKHYGLHARALPKSVAWMAEVDYLDQLSDADKEWLAKFNEETINGAFNHSEPIIPNDGAAGTAMRRSIYRAKNAANRDGLENARSTNRLLFPDQATPGESPRKHRTWESIAATSLNETDLNPTPSYLDDPRYKRALAEYRNHLPARAKDEESPELKKARARIERIVREYQAQDDYERPDDRDPFPFEVD